ncbi:PucR family transcriptional regulator ligand-binding domain-containing protein [Microbacterium sp.]|uniref:helix-turn-helix domain-containing protein n=1 Tax=Microbacterium sp. TaxID=51671 RepID=UPI003A84D304
MVGAPQPTLHALLARRDLDLRLVSDPDALADGALDAPLRWVHSSDLIDPTAFLTDGLLLLTTGTQLVDDDEVARAYVDRLAARGVRGLGFGTEVARVGMPASLERACAGARMPLVEVPYRTPFIAVARANAEAIAAQSYARRTWALDAQRAISRAALRPDGLRATVTELAQRLEVWVGLFDAAGDRVHEHPAGAVDAPTHRELSREVDRLLYKGTGAGVRLAVGDQAFSMQTLGHGGRLSGVIVTSGAPPASEARDLVTAVTALAELALAHNVALAGAHEALREALATLLLGGHADVVARVAAQAWGPLPPAPFTVAWASVPDSAAAVLSDRLELYAHEHPVFFGRVDEGMLVIAPDGAAATWVADTFDATVGVSTARDLPGVGDAYREARTAHGRARPGAAVSFDDAAAAGRLGALHTAEARALAAHHLRRLREHDLDHGAALEETLRTWLAQDAQLDAAARVLGVHRHTVRARVHQAEQLLDSDLSSFPARAQLWAAFAALA